MVDEFEYDVFLSHSSKDNDAVIELAERLRGDGLRIWLDEWVIQPGDSIPQSIEMGLESARTLILIASKSALESDWVTLERHAALFRDPSNANRRFIPLRLDDCEFGGFLKQFAYVDWRSKSNAEYYKLLRVCMPNSARLRQVSEALSSSSSNFDQYRREVAEAAEQLRLKRRKKIIANVAHDEIEAIESQLVDLKRKLRNGPQIAEGDCLSNRYLLVEQLGSGGFGTVWRAFDEFRNESVAVKILHGQLCNKEEHDRFQRGARKMQQLLHPNIVRVLDAYQSDGGFHFYVMEYLAFGNLFEAVTEKRIDKAQIRDALIDIGRALEFAHGQGVLHRDVTPENILLATNGTKLSDFDLVRAQDTTGGTRTGALGRFIYAAPENLNAANSSDERCDVYSLGMTAVFCVYGKQLPSEAFTHATAFIESLTCTDELKHVLSRAISHEIDSRFDSVSSFTNALAEAFDTSDDPVGIEIGHKLVQLVDRRKGDDLIGEIQKLRQDITEQDGFWLPRIRIRDNKALMPYEYTIQFYGKEIARGTLSELLCDSDRDSALKGTEFSPLIDHLRRCARQHAGVLLPFDNIVNIVEGEDRAIISRVSALVPKLLHRNTFHQVLKRLLSEQIPVMKYLDVVLDELSRHALTSSDPIQLAEAVRRVFADEICRPYVNGDGKLHAIVLDSMLEERLLLKLEEKKLKLSTKQVERLRLTLGEFLKQAESQQMQIALVVDCRLRNELKTSLGGAFQKLSCISTNELPEQVEIIGEFAIELDDIFDQNESIIITN